MNVTDSLIAGIRFFCSKPFSTEEIHQLKRCVVDWYCVSVAGASTIGHKLDPIVALSREGDCSIFVSKKKTDIITAAFVNSFAAHVMEMDDGHRLGMLHLEAPVISAMVALSQYENLDFEHFSKGVLAGYQTASKLAKMIQPYHKQMGFHATGTCGAIGVAAATAIALDFSDSQFRTTLGAAVTRAAGLLAAIDAPSELKPYNIAGATEVGLRSAYLSMSGLQGPNDPLSGNRGFLKVYSPSNSSMNSFDDSSEILNIYFKPYVSCRHCHAPAEAALILNERRTFRWSEIRDIKVETYRLAIVGHDCRIIDSVSAAKMSIPYCVAVSLYTGSCGIDSFSESLISNDSVKHLTRMVNVVENEVLTELSPRKRGAIVSVTVANGKTYSEYVANPLGEPEHPMSDQLLEKKYWDLISYSRTEKHKAELSLSLINNLEFSFFEFIRSL